MLGGKSTSSGRLRSNPSGGTRAGFSDTVTSILESSMALELVRDGALGVGWAPGQPHSYSSTENEEGDEYEGR